MADSTRTESTSEFADGVSVTQAANGNGLTLTIAHQSAADCVLHWGLSRRPGGAWERPPEHCWPPGTTPFDGNAVRTPFAGDGRKEVAINFDPSSPWRGLAFVIHSSKENRWIKHGGKDFQITLLRPNSRSPEEALSAWLDQEEAARQTYTLDSGDRLAASVQRTPERVRVRLVCDAERPLVLHWGLSWQFRHDWQTPPDNYRPQGTTIADKAARTPFTEREGLQYLELNFPKPAEGEVPCGMRFVLLQGEANWLKSDGNDLFLSLFEAELDAHLAAPNLAGLAEEIIGAEMGASSWTLMHRFNLCHDLLGKAGGDEDSLALLFTWLRYSAIRQLDWQRRYNTKPRELSHAQDRLTARLASVWRSHSPESRCRFWARQMFTTLGRGGDGQRVRDEILHIMHRNDLKEAAGHFIEEWHQKLHNNTTPDDVVICQAYLAFLRSNGDATAFYRTLEQGGVTRARLQSFERPIKSEPVFYADRKDALIGEFEHFLSILKSVHSGTDLDSAIAAARGRLDGGLNKQFDDLLALRAKLPSAGVLAAAVTSAREGLAKTMAANKDDAALRDLLFLDLALEECLRATIERESLSDLQTNELAELVLSALRNLCLTVVSAELPICSDHWSALLGLPREGRDWALHARAVTERIARWVQEFTSDIYQRLQSKAEALGAAFHAEPWTIPLFSEEVIRGGPAFTLSLLLRPLDRMLRQQAGLGGWQIISSASGGGKVRAVKRLLDVQSERFSEPTVLVADEVSGDEEIPEGAKAVLTCDAPDLVSHVAVRARNVGVLFATCFDQEEYQRLRELAGKTLSLLVTPSGDVEYQEGEVSRDAQPSANALLFEPRLNLAEFAGWVIGQEEFKPDIVGGKSNNLNGLRGRLADWMYLPKSIALPFGVFERVLADERNRRLREECDALIAQAGEKPSDALAQVRTKVLQLSPPPDLQGVLREHWQHAGLPPVPWEQTWSAVRRVWASKWNDRAYLSRRARGIPHDSLQMAVLIQEVVPADYAFVIHTANPLTGARGEIFAEVVLGMGETLVGNYPGRALSFLCKKSDLQPEILSYPSKSIGIYGKGVIFRSDSNGEDLPGFAGAGLYDSFLAEEPEHRLLDYRGEKLVWDAKFRDELLRSIARIGAEVERLLGSAQDIEGAIAGGRYYIVQTRPQVGLSADDSLAA
ncbi:MAG TPA: PEP/pyruvate-binding domain-containing protein [Gemmataceae bacterium]|nr:PEP/pyruvate-binding domain-containing protein [Gemmataceae bacterium]